jgi:hypothetical protein
MSLLRFSIILISAILVIESGVGLWRARDLKPSGAPVFTFPPVVPHFDNPGRHADGIAMYRADRGGECELELPDGVRVTVIQFEWDQVESGPLMSLAAHSPDECNVAAGFDLNRVLPNRIHEVDGQPPLIFDSTHFTDAAGRSVYMFKMPWIQGVGSWYLRESERRMERLKSSFIRKVGQARMLQAGVFGARDADHAWQVFQSEVLEKLEWTD